ncbi:class II aldolase/adducin family protein [Paraburkholderia sp.]|uniref:class II aldolase/adducin family protein n=1 Tax=Paraburkholderia sp. TaxID=1926495 RepID=UPI00286F9FCE|nr:class II aldolase/adducin family protein [Paraburkholderia sp.]
MNESSAELRERVAQYCASIGGDPLLVQGAGGNVSWKDGQVLHVKASGMWLAEAAAREIFVPVDLASLGDALEAGNFEVKPQTLGESSLRPSIETLLHALMPQRIVMHLHAVEVLAHLVRGDAEDFLRERVGDQLSWAIVDYQKPGAALAQAVYLALRRTPDAQVIFLRNHGVVVGAESIEQADEIIRELCQSLATPPLVSETEHAVVAVDSGGGYCPVDDAAIHDLALRPELFSRLEAEWALYPDHVVFLGAAPELYRSESEFLASRTAGMQPELAFVAGCGVFVRDTFNLAKTVQLRCYRDVMVRQPDPAQTSTLTPEQVADLLDWDAERYRMSLAK